MWKRRRLTAKRYPGDNRLIFPKSSYRRDGLAPRCRLVASWGRSRSQGLGCSPIKAVRELGLERRTLRPYGVIRRCSPAHIGETLTVTYRTYNEGNTEGRPTHAIFAALNYFKRKQISAVDVERHLRSMGVLCPCNDFLDLAHREDGVSSTSNTDAMTRRPLERG